ncbi:MAG: DUF3881 family protein [Lachnospiraceae bacterium]|nr:DUF3881 family protein [Lachnospiraceae bacterium]
MHSYLKSIGFACCKTNQVEEKLLDEVIDSAMRRSQISIRPETDIQFAEYSLDFCEDMGITVRGQIDEEDNFHIDHYFPYLRPRNITSNEEVFINKRSDSDSYAALCDDMRVGVSLIFYLQNAIDFLRNNRFDTNNFVLPTKLSGLAAEGAILLPTLRSMKDIDESKIEISKHVKMISDAKNGNQEAIEKLTIEEIDNYALVGKRVKTEDVFSIVDTSFAPYGMESEVYKILGVILSVEERVNRATHEHLYVMEIYCNHLVFDVCINEENLLGQPAVGRRFRGVIWLQGLVEFGK